MIPGLGRSFGEAKGYRFYFFVFFFKGFPDSSIGKESACNVGDPSWIPGSGRSSGEGISYLLQYSWASLWLSWERIHRQCRGPGFYSWVWKIPEEGKGYPLQYSSLENSTDCIVHEKSQTLLSDFLQTFNT